LRESWLIASTGQVSSQVFAADADLGVDQMLAQDGRWGGGHGFFPWLYGRANGSGESGGAVIPGLPPDHVRGWRRNDGAAAQLKRT
jgi:hypothetical protein